MNILIVDGNEKKASEKYTNLGMDTQYEVYAKVLRKLFNGNNNLGNNVHPKLLIVYKVG